MQLQRLRAAEHRACSSLDTFSYRQIHFRFDLSFQFVTHAARQDQHDAWAALMIKRTRQMELWQVILPGVKCYLVLSKIKLSDYYYFFQF